MRMLRNVGLDVYRGWDRGLNRSLEIQQGEVAPVSDAECEALLGDFPGRFQELGQTVDTAAPIEADNVIGSGDLGAVGRVGPNVTKPARARRAKQE